MPLGVAALIRGKLVLQLRGQRSYDVQPRVCDPRRGQWRAEHLAHVVKVSARGVNDGAHAEQREQGRKSRADANCLLCVAAWPTQRGASHAPAVTLRLERLVGDGLVEVGVILRVRLLAVAAVGRNAHGGVGEGTVPHAPSPRAAAAAIDTMTPPTHGRVALLVGRARRQRPDVESLEEQVVQREPALWKATGRDALTAAGGREWSAVLCGCGHGAIS